MAYINEVSIDAWRRISHNNKYGNLRDLLDPEDCYDDITSLHMSPRSQAIKLLIRNKEFSIPNY